MECRVQSAESLPACKAVALVIIEQYLVKYKCSFGVPRKWQTCEGTACVHQTFLLTGKECSKKCRNVELGAGKAMQWNNTSF